MRRVFRQSYGVLLVRLEEKPSSRKTKIIDPTERLIKQSKGRPTEIIRFGKRSWPILEN